MDIDVNTETIGNEDCWHSSKTNKKIPVTEPVEDTAKNNLARKKNSPELKELPDRLRDVLGDSMVVYKIKPDGVCAPRCAALWLSMDQSLGYVLGGVINDNFRKDWHFWKGFFSFPFKAVIGSGKEEIFDTEEDLLAFLKTNKSAFLWRGDEDFTVICSIYRLNIKIYKPDGQLTVIEPRIDVPSPIGLPDGKVDDMLILYDGSHYDLIVPRDGILATVGGLDFQRSQKSRLTDEEITVAECINEDECKETNEKDDISKEATIKSLKHQIGRLNLEKEKLLKKNELDKEKLKKEEKKNEILQRKLDALGVNVSKL